MAPICRACLSSKTYLQPIDDTFIRGYKTLTNLTINTSDGLPQNTCATCLESLTKFLQFRDTCIESENTLQQILLETTDSKENILVIETYVKEECKSEPDFDGDHQHKDFSCDTNSKEIKEPTQDIIQSDFKINEEFLSCSDNDVDFEGYGYKELKARSCKGQKRKIIPTTEKFIEDVPNTEIKTESKDNLSCDFEPTQDDIAIKINEEFLSCSHNNDDLEGYGYKELKARKSKRHQRKTIKTLEKGKEDVPNIEIKTESNDNLACGLCLKDFDDKTQLYEHLEGHKKYKNCNICYEKFQEWPSLMSHRIVHLSKIKEKICHYCEKRYKGVYQLELHYRSLHFDGEKSLSCKYCMKKVNGARKLNRHIKHNHVNTSAMFQCDYCKKLFSNKPSLKTHLGKHSEDKPYKCDLCDFACRFRSGVLAHKLRRHNKTKLICCNKCGRRFPNVELKMAHTCKSGSSAVCPICGVVKNKGLKEHMYTHNTLFKCKLCPAEFKTRGALKVHTDKHDGFRRYGCEYCTMRFFSYSVLVKHKRVHTGEKPFVCKVCGRGFTGNHNLKVHMKVHGEDLVTKRVKNPPTVDRDDAVAIN